VISGSPEDLLECLRIKKKEGKEAKRLPLEDLHARNLSGPGPDV
jgi:hypothetical protein